MLILVNELNKNMYSMHDVYGISLLRSFSD